MSLAVLDFEKPLYEKIDELDRLRAKDKPTSADALRLRTLEGEIEQLRREIYGGLTPIQRIKIARHMARPRSLDYVQYLFSGWTEVHGDRGFADDQACLAGYARFDDVPCAVIGQQKGKDTKENLARNFGMMHPEGYRKALRIMRNAVKFDMPIFVFIDTPGAYPGIGAEERGQAEAIARNLLEMARMPVPILCTVIGEGASGGALGIGVGDRLLMLENSWYCVISPEGCASILFRDASHAPRAAEALKLTGPDLVAQGIVDEVIPEPPGGAHRDFETTAKNIQEALRRHFAELQHKDGPTLVEERYQRYRRMGVFEE
ncbi:MAG: acetyl-CoA carboxylase carboxyltransferase subunit alpha [Candidatus Sumerlaeia bacterium]|nr:acetyl-CoA carboxylase carboxyltransferase subunit alpha [Candidatus Sumerlaeia bacterium]